MGISIPSVLGQMIVFLLFVMFTMKYVWPPIMKAMEEREAKIRDGLAAAEKGKAALAEASSKSDEELKAARTQAQDIIAAANKQATQLVEKAKGDATAEQQRIIASGHAEVEQMAAQARDALRKQVADLAVSGAEQILKREVDAKAHAEILDRLAARI
ncbi:MAG: F0F1 ATP synthase subunit B [Polycyclovorans sp.]|jgi:F-type H+-transporting ATPase subunit b|nr:F0F1 ATP synthase subunit B [Polycyclovorans sp.]MBU0789273.1 F0F1 ATP synthase subunit B [Gammaproteobacteria bacterium]MDP1542511.1 F0F1 ATP synthase subunit B [Polycyclovorans sp.]MEC8849932.1 F0F1 ATP synthase subunit B [Pseudomonadota bacterium]|tara:strand:+ start:23876 stop:24349 length:474 start_codon:yes stop_codon:yes gene_type:complete